MHICFITENEEKITTRKCIHFVELGATGLYTMIYAGVYFGFLTFLCVRIPILFLIFCNKSLLITCFFDLRTIILFAIPNHPLLPSMYVYISFYSKNFSICCCTCLNESTYHIINCVDWHILLEHVIKCE